MLYRLAFDNLITRTDPERAHHLALEAIAKAGGTEAGRRALRATFGHLPKTPVRDERLLVFARPFPARLGLAAGMDKNATAVLGLGALGFAFVEIGTVTRHAQPGNDQPRLWRHPEIASLRNRMGFNNDGADTVAARLGKLRATKAGRQVIIGVNIGKSKITPASQAADDYAYSANALARYADYLVINVSSPNTPGLRDLQSVNQLAPIIDRTRSCAMRSSGRDVPLLVKIAPDLVDEDIGAVAELVRREGICGMVATNTTINHDFGAGGLSGAALSERSLQVVKLARQALGLRPVLMGVGGITTVDDAKAMLQAGADLLQGYSAFVYKGPSWPGKINRALADQH